MNYKKVMRYIRLNSLVPELLDKVDTKQMGFIPSTRSSMYSSSNSVLRSLTVKGSSLATAQQKVLTALLYLGRLWPIRFTKR